MFLFIACVINCLCTAQATTDEDILFMFNGDTNPCTSTDDAILYVYGGGKVHQYAVVADNKQSSDELIAYMYGGEDGTDTDAELVAFLLGGDEDSVEEATTPEEDSINVLYGSAQTSSATVPAGMEIIPDDVALMDRCQCMHSLTEWSPTESYSKGTWMLDARKADDAQRETDLTLYILGGQSTSESGFGAMSEYLFGSIAVLESQIMHDVDRVDALAGHGMETDMDIVELVELADAADSKLAHFLYGGVQQEDENMDEDLATFLYGGDGMPHEEHKSLVELADEHANKIADIVTLVDRNENELTNFLLGGKTQSTHTAVAGPSTETDLVDLIEHHEAVDYEIASFVLGGDTNHVQVNSLAPMEQESESSTIAFLYDGAGQRTDADIVDFLFGGEEVQQGDGDLATYLYGSSPPYATTKSVPASVRDIDELGLITYLLGDEQEDWSMEDDVIQFILGGDAVEKQHVTKTLFSDSPTPLHKVQALSPAPYTQDANEDCSDHECISRTLRKLQTELGISDADLDDGIIWGEDMVSYCQWQAGPGAQLKQGKDTMTYGSNAECVDVSCPTARVPPLPTSYSSFRPPSASTCKQVLSRFAPIQHLSSSH